MRRKTKSYNRQPSPLARPAIATVGAAVGFAAGVSASPQVTSVLTAVASSPVGRAVPLAAPDPASVASVVTAVMATLGAAAGLMAGLHQWRGFHDGAWMGPTPVRGLATRGSARLLSKPRDLRRVSGPFARDRMPASPGLVVGAARTTSGYGLRCVDVTHALVLGDTGARKTRTVVLPSLVEEVMAGASVVVTDPKGEAFLYTRDWLRSQGVEPILVDLAEPSRSTLGWDPVSAIARAHAAEPARAASEAALLAASVVSGADDDFWVQSARALVSAAALYVATTESIPDAARNLSTVSHLVNAPGRGDGGLLADLAAELPAGDATRLALEAVTGAAGDTMQGIVSTANASLHDFVDAFMGRLLARDGLDLDALADGRQFALFVAFGSESAAYRQVVSCLLSQVIVALRRGARRAGGRLGRDVFLLLDEIGSCPPIPSLGAHVAVARSEGIHFVFVLQGLGQLERAYGPQAADVANNCSLTLFLSGNEPETLRHMSDRLGSYTASEPSWSHTRRDMETVSSGSSTGHVAVPLIRPEDLALWDASVGHLAVIGGHVYTFASPDLSETFVEGLLGMGDEEHDARLRKRRRAEAGTIELEAPQVWTPKTAEEVPTPGLAPVDVPATATTGAADGTKSTTAPPEPVDPRFF